MFNIVKAHNLGEDDIVRTFLPSLLLLFIMILFLNIAWVLGLPYKVLQKYYQNQVGVSLIGNYSSQKLMLCHSNNENL